MHRRSSETLELTGERVRQHGLLHRLGEVAENAFLPLEALKGVGGKLASPIPDSPHQKPSRGILAPPSPRQVRPAERGGQPSWLVTSLDVLAAALVIVDGLGRPGCQAGPRRARVGRVVRLTAGSRRFDWAAAPTRQPITLLAIGCSPILLAAMATRRVSVRARLLERIPWPLTLARDLGKRPCAQR
jgi:hypothetical protein